jgi:hypothetical protein
MKNLLLTLILSLIGFSLVAQVDLGIPVATGKGGAVNGIVYDWECIGINPSNLGWEKNHRVSISALIFGISAQSRAMDYAHLKNAILHPNDTFSKADKETYAATFSGSEGLNLQVNMNWLTFSFRVPKVGGFAMNLRDRAFGHIKLNKNASEILFLGKDAPIFKDTAFWLQPDSKKTIGKVYEGSKAGFLHYRELNLSYGTKIVGIGGTKDSSKISIYGGIGFKYLWGLGNMEMIAENSVLIGHSAFSSKYGIYYSDVKNFSPDHSASTAGSGIAFDIGGGVGFGRFKITVSAVDIGKLTWNKNVLMINDTILDSSLVTQGLNSWNLFKNNNMFRTDSGMFKFKPGNPYETNLPSKFRLGVGWQMAKRTIVGADMVLPISNNPTNLNGAFFAIGTEMALASNFKLSFGFAGNSTYKFAMPCGVTLGSFFKIMELSIATNDILTFIFPGKDPHISLSLSLFRFNLSDKK